MSFPLYRCAACGSPHVVETTQTDGIKYDFVKGAIGTVVLGTGGAVAGISNRTKKAFQCPDCGLTLDHPMPMELKCSIDLGVSSSRMRNGILVGGMQFTWEEITKQFRNIESGDGDEEIAQKKMSEEELLFSKATATQEEFDQAFDTLHQYATQNYSTKNLPTKKAYSAAVAALYTVVENCFKYLPPSKIQRKYDGFTPYRGWENFRLSYCFDDYTLFRYYELSGKYFDSIFTFLKLEPCDIRIIESRDPFIPLLVKRYQLETGMGGLWRYFKNDNSAGFNVCTPTMPCPDWDGLYNDQIFWQVRTILGGFEGKDELDDEIRVTVAVPKLWTDESGFAYTDWAFPDSPLFDQTQESSPQKNLYFESFPEKKAEYEELLNEFRSSVQKRDQARKTAKFAVEQIEKQIKYNESKRFSLALKKDEYQQQVNELSKKKFGKAKVQPEIERLQGLIAEVGQEKDKLSAEGKALPKSLEEKKKEYNDACSIESEREVKILQKRICSKMNYFIVWHPIEEPEEEDSLSDPSESLTEEVKKAAPDNQAASSSNPSAFADQLRELKALLDEGILTQEEFAAKKKQFLGL